MGNSDDKLAPAVQSILEAARQRAVPDRRLDVDPQSLSTAFDAAEANGRVPVIAEIKPTSPTTAGTSHDNPVDLAETIVAGGAAALSVLTEPDHFEGSPENLNRVREAVDVPVLRKDFILREAQLDRVAADVVLLIARFVGDDLDDLLSAARERGFQALVEVHTAAELQRAIAAGADYVGINNRDLSRLEVDLDTFGRVAPAAADDVTLIAESGIGDVADVRRMREAGADALLIGTAIMDGAVQANTERFTDANPIEETTNEH